MNGYVGTPTILGNVICGNVTTIEGGGLTVFGGGRVSGNFIVGNRILASKATLLFGGGGVSLSSATNLVFANNLVKETRCPLAASSRPRGF